MNYKTWGTDIDQATHDQMAAACTLPVAVAGALMPDAHLGYGLPIGGVLACENAVVPYAVGVDIACRMRLSVFDIPAGDLLVYRNAFRQALIGNTLFGTGGEWDTPHDHPVMDADWGITHVTEALKDKAHRQLGTSGSGNHFAEFGTYIDAPGESGEYRLAFLTHSGSRGPGARVCEHYSKLAQSIRPAFGHLAWLEMDEPQGEEYWAAMQLMGQYAAANHEVIHRLIAQYLGMSPSLVVENHHNFAWKETLSDREVIVHRKGATPAHSGTMGIIPGTMEHPAFVVVGKGSKASLHSSSHGAGRVMSRSQARKQFDRVEVFKSLSEKGITVIGSGADEVPAVYKDIRKVMAEQSDLVEIIGEFQPKIVRMA